MAIVLSVRYQNTKMQWPLAINHTNGIDNFIVFGEIAKKTELAFLR